MELKSNMATAESDKSEKIAQTYPVDFFKDVFEDDDGCMAVVLHEVHRGNVLKEHLNSGAIQLEGLNLSRG